VKKPGTPVIILAALAISMLMSLFGCSGSLTNTLNSPGVLTTIPPVPPGQTAVGSTSSPSGLITNAPISTTPGDPGINPSPVTATPPGEVTTPVKQVTVNLTALDMAFDKSVITVPAGAQVTINFVNKDGVGHNFAAYTNEAATTPIFVGDIIDSSTIIYRFTAPALPGIYFFRCDPHAKFMKGQFIVQ